MQGAVSRVLSAEFRVQGPGFGVQGAGFRVQGAGCRVQGAGFRGGTASSRTTPVPLSTCASSVVWGLGCGI